MVQGITGIPYYYRLFGYEMALDLAGRRFGYEPNVPKLKDGEEEPCRIRPATEADLSFIAELYERAIQRHAIACVRTPEVFNYELSGQSENSVNRFVTLVIEDKTGEPVGYFQHYSALGLTGLTALWYELKPGISWLAVTPGVVRYLWNQGQEYSQREGKPRTSFGFARRGGLPEGGIRENRRTVTSLRRYSRRRFTCLGTHQACARKKAG
jgi:hypothetical protein